MDGILRPEARPLGIKKLTRPQRDALELILGTLETAVAQLRAKKPRESTPSRLDKTRASRIVFLSGEPGTGKTTVYLSLRYAIEACQEELPSKTCDELKDARGKKGSTQPEPETRIREGIRELRGRVIWLEPMNLETVADTTTNYLAAILARIDRVLAEELRKRSGKQTRTSGLFEHSGLDEALVEFQRLRADIGLAWDGNLPRRGEHLDPDAYAEEVMRAEGARIQVSDRFRRVLEDLTDEPFRRSRPPLFVLPVDDLYLNPKPSWELLRLLRMISVPHLFILAMGDEHVIEDLLYQRQLGELIQLAGDRTARRPHQERIVTARARQISYETTRKLLPPAQRVTLEVSYWDQAAQLRPADCSVSGVPEHEVHCYTLGRFLELLPLDLDFGVTSGNTPSTLMEFLRLPGDSKVGEAGERWQSAQDEHIPDADAYAGMQILEAPPRSLLDLWFAIQRILELRDYQPRIKWTDIEKFSKLKNGGDKIDPEQYRPTRKKIINMVAAQALQALNEQAYLRYDDLVEIENAITGSLYLPRRLNAETLEVRSETSLPFSLPLGQAATNDGDQQPARAITMSLEIRRHQRWRMRPISTPHPENLLYHHDFLPPRPVAWFVLLHDLLVLSRDEGIEGIPLSARRMDNNWVRLRWTPSLKSWADESFFVPWPNPRWPSFWQYDTFLLAWNRLVKLARPEDNANCDEDWDAAQRRLVDTLAYWWIRLAVSVFQLRDDVFFRDVDDRCIFKRLESKHLLSCVDPLRPRDEATDSSSNTEEAGSSHHNAEREKIESDHTRNLEELWRGLSGDLQRLSDETQSKRKSGQPEALADAERWLVHVGVMMMPEYGLSPAIVKLFLDGEPWIGQKRLWRRPEVSGYIRELRAETLLPLLQEADLEPKGTWRGLIQWEDKDKDKELVFLIEDERFSDLASDGSWNPHEWNPRPEDIALARERRRATQRHKDDSEDLHSKDGRQASDCGK